MDEIKKDNYVLTPGRYVGIKDEEDDGLPFEEKMAGFWGELKEQMAGEKRLNKEIEKQLSHIGALPKTRFFAFNEYLTL